MEKLIRRFLQEKPGYLKKSDNYILSRLDLHPITKEKLNTCRKIRRSIIKKTDNSTSQKSTVHIKKPDYNKYLGVSNRSKKPAITIKPNTGLNPDNVLVIGDLHEPFCLEGYLEFCLKIQKERDCGTVVFIGDVIDNHYSSYHEQDPDGFGAGEELERAIYKLKRWYKAFPNATVIIGNHDRIIYRKAFSSGLSKRWVRDLNEVLETPNWDFVESIMINNVDFNHGEGGTAKTRMKNEMTSQVQGHRHSEFYLQYNISPALSVFAMQVGCGVNTKSYAMAYGKHFKKPAIGCGTVENINGNPTPHLFPMQLK
jgi:hypothetical protein